MPWRHMRAGIAYLLASRRRAGEADGCWLALFLISCLILRVRPGRTKPTEKNRGARVIVFDVKLLELATAHYSAWAELQDRPGPA